MYICLCKSVTDHDIRRSVLRGDVRCMGTLKGCLGASTGCGCCEATARACLEEALAEKRLAGRKPPTAIDCDLDAVDPWDGGCLGDASPA